MGRKRYSKPIFAQVQTQAQLTLALLPLVAALPFLSDEMLARLFGLSALPSLRELDQRPPTQEEKRHYQREYKREYRHRNLTQKQQQEEQRAYWREAQRIHRERIKTQKGKPK
jgi:hypothetical protein